MQISTPELMTDIRNRFAQIDTCPEQGQRIFFENAGGALTLKSVVETSARYAAIPDNQGRDDVASKAGNAAIATAKGQDTAAVVAALNACGIRTHIRKADHYSGNMLSPLGLESCIRISMCHYNTEVEVLTLLAALDGIL